MLRSAWNHFVDYAQPVQMAISTERSHVAREHRISCCRTSAEQLFKALRTAEIAGQNVPSPEILFPTKVAVESPPVINLILEAADTSKTVKRSQWESVVDDVITHIYHYHEDAVLRLWNQYVITNKPSNNTIPVGPETYVALETFADIVGRLRSATSAWTCRAAGCEGVYGLASALSHVVEKHDGSAGSMDAAPSGFMKRILKDNKLVGARFNDLEDGKKLFMCQRCPSDWAELKSFSKVVSILVRSQPNSLTNDAECRCIITSSTRDGTRPPSRDSQVATNLTMITTFDRISSSLSMRRTGGEYKANGRRKPKASNPRHQAQGARTKGRIGAAYAL